MKSKWVYRTMLVVINTAYEARVLWDNFLCNNSKAFRFEVPVQYNKTQLHCTALGKHEFLRQLGSSFPAAIGFQGCTINILTSQQYANHRDTITIHSNYARRTNFAQMRRGTAERFTTHRFLKEVGSEVGFIFDEYHSYIRLPEGYCLNGFFQKL